MYVNIVPSITDYIKHTKKTQTISPYAGKQTFVTELDGFTVFRCCCKITLVNNTSNIQLVPMFRSWSSYQQPGKKHMW